MVTQLRPLAPSTRWVTRLAHFVVAFRIVRSSPGTIDRIEGSLPRARCISGSSGSRERCRANTTDVSSSDNRCVRITTSQCQTYRTCATSNNLVERQGFGNAIGDGRSGGRCDGLIDRRLLFIAAQRVSWRAGERWPLICQLVDHCESRQNRPARSDDTNRRNRTLSSVQDCGRATDNQSDSRNLSKIFQPKWGYEVSTITDRCAAFFRLHRAGKAYDDLGGLLMIECGWRYSKEEGFVVTPAQVQW